MDASHNSDQDQQLEDSAAGNKNSLLFELSQEIVDLICQQIICRDDWQGEAAPKWSQEDRENMKNARYISQAFDIGACRMLFHQVAANVKLTSHERMMEIARSPRIAPYVRTVTLSACVRPDPGLPRRVWNGFGFTVTDLPRVVQNYKKGAIPKGVFKKPAKLRKDLAIAFKKFANLTKLVLGKDPLCTNKQLDGAYVNAWLSALDVDRYPRLTHLVLERSVIAKYLADHWLMGLKKKNIRRAFIQLNLGGLRELSLAGKEQSSWGGFGMGDWQSIKTIFINLQAVNMSNMNGSPIETLGLSKGPFIGKDVTRLSIDNSTIRASALATTMSYNHDTLRHIIIKCKLTVGAWCEVFDYVDQNCSTLFTARFETEVLRPDETFAQHFMWTGSGTCLGGCRLTGDDLAAFKRMYRTIDKNRKEAGLRPMYHPVMTGREYRDYCLNRQVVDMDLDTA